MLDPLGPEVLRHRPVAQIFDLRPDVGGASVGLAQPLDAPAVASRRAGVPPEGRLIGRLPRQGVVGGTDHLGDRSRGDRAQIALLRRAGRGGREKGEDDEKGTRSHGRS